MIRLKELKEKKYNPKYEELYKFLYSVSIDAILDLSNTEKDTDGLNISIRDNMKEEIRIRKTRDDFIIVVEFVDNNKYPDCEYQKIEYYSFKCISNLVSKLKELLKKLSDIVLIEYENRPHKATYDLLTYANLDLIADNSLWMELQNDDLSLFLADELLKKMIHINYEKRLHHNSYVITCNDFDEDIKSTPYEETFIKQTFDTEEEMLEVLKEIIKPCLRKKRLRDIGTKYKNSIEATKDFGKAVRKRNKKQGRKVC